MMLHTAYALTQALIQEKRLLLSQDAIISAANCLRPGTHTAVLQEDSVQEQMLMETGFQQAQMTLADIAVV